MPPGSTPFRVASDGCELRARSYAPDRNARPGAAVLLLHGIFSSSEIFDIPGLEAISLARRLQQDGLHVITYDQRGGGDSTVASWAFGMREHARVDLPAVISDIGRRFNVDRIAIGGYSLGGKIWLKWASEALMAGPTLPLPRIAAGLVIASPAFLDRAFPPWSDFADRGRSFVETIDKNGDAAVSPAEFVRGQALLYEPWLWPILPPWGIELTMRMGARSPALAWGVRRFPIRSLIYNTDDFDDHAYMHMLRSRALDRGSNQLLLELFDEIGPAPPASPTIDLEVLCIGSSADRLVPLRTVEGLASRFRVARVVSTERDYGADSGHAGYFFKTGVRDFVHRDVRDYLLRVLTA